MGDVVGPGRPCSRWRPAWATRWCSSWSTAPRRRRLGASAPLALAAMGASSTVRLRFDGLFVPDGRRALGRAATSVAGRGPGGHRPAQPGRLRHRRHLRPPPRRHRPSPPSWTSAAAGPTPWPTPADRRRAPGRHGRGPGWSLRPGRAGRDRPGRGRRRPGHVRSTTRPSACSGRPPSSPSRPRPPPSGPPPSPASARVCTDVALADAACSTRPPISQELRGQDAGGGSRKNSGSSAWAAAHGRHRAEVEVVGDVDLHPRRSRRRRGRPPADAQPARARAVVGVVAHAPVAVAGGRRRSSRTATIGRPPRRAAASMTAATSKPLNPSRYPVPTTPGPGATTTASAPRRHRQLQGRGHVHRLVVARRRPGRR